MCIMRIIHYYSVFILSRNISQLLDTYTGTNTNRNLYISLDIFLIYKKRRIADEVLIWNTNDWLLFVRHFICFLRRHLTIYNLSSASISHEYRKIARQQIMNFIMKMMRLSIKSWLLMFVLVFNYLECRRWKWGINRNSTRSPSTNIERHFRDSPRENLMKLDKTS
jgi:hypothetical protein